jgi:hypothetical protein
MIGYGGGQGETWGLNTVTQKNLSVQLNGYSYTTTDFETAYGTTTYTQGPFTASVTNDYDFILGDSGGAGFIYNGSTWQLAGINEAVDEKNSFLVQLSAYSTQINAVTSVPEMSTPAFLVLGLLAWMWGGRPRSFAALG